MPTKADLYKGLDNRDLKLINVDDWEISGPSRNPQIKKIMGTIKYMEPGEILKVFDGKLKEAILLHSAVWRLIKRHQIPVRVIRRDARIFLKRGEEA